MKKIVLAALVLSLACLVAYEPLRHNGFVSFDDSKYITANRHVLAGLTSETIRWAFTTTHFHSWHPITWLSHALDCTIFGLNPKGHHLHNLFLHIINAILFLLILHRLTKQLLLSFVGAALWAVHPLRVEAVAWATGRKDMLVGLFFLLALYSFLHYRQLKSNLCYGLLLFFFVCGLMSKPMIVTLPFLLLLMDYLGPNEAKLKLSFKELTPLFLLSCLFSGLFYWTQASGGSLSPLAELPFSAKLMNSISSYTLYLWQTVYPLGLACLYPHPQENIAPSLLVLSLFLLVGLTFLLVQFSKKEKAIVLGWFWFLGTLVPVIGLVQLGTHARADRFTYIPAMGLSLLFIKLLLLLEDKNRQWLLVGLIVPFLLSIHLTRQQVTTWRNSQSLYEHALHHTEKNYVIHNNLGAHLQAKGKLLEAEEHFRQAVKIQPDFAEAMLNLVDLLEKKGRNKEAAKIFEKLAHRFPNYAPVHFKLGQLARARSENGEACIHLQKALSLAPDLAPAYNDYGLALRALGRNAEAKAHFEKAVQLDKNLAASWFNLAILAHLGGDVQQALPLYQKAIAANENFVEAWANMAVALQSVQKFSEAEKAYERTLQLQKNNLDVTINYALLLRQRKKYAQAAHQFQRALAIGGPNREIEAALKELSAKQ